MKFKEMPKSELNSLYLDLLSRYEEYKSQQLSLDMSRGKPCLEQLNLSLEIFDTVSTLQSPLTEGGLDTRNYGGVDGIPEAKELFAELLGVSPAEVIVGGNSSLNMMHDTILRATVFGLPGSQAPWGKLPKVKFLCPSPGYDRHFAICELFNIEMVVIDMLQSGPDMEAVEKLAAEDESIKGIWCVPKYSNPDGYTYSDETVDRMAAMKAKAGDFRIFWDDAYTVHHLTEEPDELKNILTACKAAGNPDRVFIFASTSKITFAGAGVAVTASSEKNINYLKKLLAIQTIGPDKINQLRHVRFLKNMDNLKAHMAKHAQIIKPKFDIVLNTLEAELGGLNIATWTKPTGGYFISLNTLDGCAKAVVSMAAAAGVTLTGAGATYPYGKDPRDRNIRLAPTFPSLPDLKAALEIVALCVKIVSAQKILSA